MIRPGTILLTTFTLMALFAPPFLHATSREIVIGVLGSRPQQESAALWQPVAEHLQRSLPGIVIRITPLTYPEMEEAFSNKRLDFTLINPGYYLQFRERMGLTGVLATLVEQEKGRPLYAFGGVIFTRSDRHDINDLSDLQNRKIAAVDPNSLGGYQAQRYQLAKAGVSPPERNNQLFTGLPHDTAITAVLNGLADVGFARTGVIEKMVSEKHLDPTRLKIINRQQLADFPYAISTRLYPQWPFIALPHVKEQLARKVTAALLSMEPPGNSTTGDGIYGFTVPADYEPVDRLLKELRLPPYDEIPLFSATDVLKRYNVQIISGSVTFITVIMLLFHLTIINRRLTGVRKKAQKNEEDYRQLLDLTPIPIGIVTDDNTISYVNRRFVTVFGYQPEEIRTVAHWMLRAYPDELTRLSATTRWGEALACSKASNSPVPPNEYTITCNDGTEKFVEISGMPIENSLLVVFHDITERKIAEAEQVTMQRQLLHTQKLESLGVLAGGIAHDFNNILTAILGNAELAMIRVGKDSPVQANLRNIEKASSRAADLARQMLAYSGKGKFVVEQINLNNLLQDMLDMLEVSLSKKAVLHFNLQPHLPPIEADATQLRQVIMNLTINASEALGDNCGAINITTGCIDSYNNYMKDIWQDENIEEGYYVFLEIADTGCGMSQETVTRLFDPFFTTKFTGRGLGMAVVLGIIRGHKGTIKVYSEPFKGTTFKILLPTTNKPPEKTAADIPGRIWHGTGTVLLVDDEESVRGTGMAMLQELGFTTITAENGRQAIDKFNRHPGIECVILDLTMPLMDGAECFRELRQINPHIRIIISSGYNELEVTTKFAGAGLTGFIQKPYRLSALREALQGT